MSDSGDKAQDKQRELEQEREFYENMSDNTSKELAEILQRFKQGDYLDFPKEIRHARTLEETKQSIQSLMLREQDALLNRLIDKAVVYYIPDAGSISLYKKVICVDIEAIIDEKAALKEQLNGDK